MARGLVGSVGLPAAPDDVEPGGLRAAAYVNPSRPSSSPPAPPVPPTPGGTPSPPLPPLPPLPISPARRRTRRGRRRRRCRTTIRRPRRARRTRPRRRCRTTIRRPRRRPRSVGAVTDQRAPQRRQEGRVDRVEQRTGYGRGAGGLGGRIRARARGQGLHKLDMKRRRLRAERLIGLAVRPKSRRDGHRHLIGARGQHRRRVGRGRGVGRPDRRTDACQIRGRCRDGLRRRDHKRYVTPPKRSWPNKPGQPGRDAQVFQRLMDRSALHRPTGSEIPGFPALLTDPWVFGSAR